MILAILLRTERLLHFPGRVRKTITDTGISMALTEFSFAFLPFVLLVLAVLSAYIKYRLVLIQKPVPIWSLFLLASLLSAYVAQLVDILSLSWLALLLAAVFAYRQLQMGWSRELLYAFILILSFALITRSLPGFASTAVYENTIFGTSVFPTTLHLHYGRGFTGVLLFCALARRIGSLSEIRAALAAAGKVPLFITAYFVLGYILWYVPDPKFNADVVRYLVANLFFISLADEAFFRLLVQDRLERFFGDGDTESMYLAAVISTVLFALSYYIHGVAIEAAILIFIAGLIYAYTYGKTRRVEISILAHFLIDGILITGFLYP